MKWMTDFKGEKWCPTACVTYVCDGHGIYLAGPPVPQMCDKVEQQCRNGNYGIAADMINRTLSAKEKLYEDTELRAAGHMLSFHPGEQLHCGVGSRGYRCSLTGLKRATLFCLAIPARYYDWLNNMGWIGTEANTYGLVDKVDTNRVLFFSP